MNMEVSVIAGEASKKFIVDFKEQIDRLENLLGKKGLEGAEATSGELEEEEEIPSKPKRAKKKAAANFEDDNEVEAAVDTEEAEEAQEEDDFTAPSKKAAKPKKITVDDVNDACKKRATSAGKKGRAEVIAILKKKFKTETISDLKPEQYADCIEAMEV